MRTKSTPPWSQIVAKGCFLHLLVALSQLVEHIELLSAMGDGNDDDLIMMTIINDGVFYVLAQIDWLVHHHPCGGLPTSRKGCADQ